MLGVGKSTVEIIIAAKDRTQAAFAKVNTQMKTMGGTSGKLNSAMGSLKGGLSKVTSSLGSFGAALGPVGIAVAGLGVAMATVGGAAFKASLEFEKAFATIRVGTGATGDALKGFEEDFRAIFGETPANAAAISQALTAMTNVADASGTTLQDLTTNIMNVSRMLGEDGAANAQVFSDAMEQWQIPAASGVGLMDQFFKITQVTGIGFSELTGAMNAYGPVLQNAGFTAAQSAELFGRLEGSGIAVSRVMPGLNAAFRKWAEEGKNGKDSLEAIIAAIMNAETSMEALTIATDAFGAEGAQRMTTAVRNGTFELSSLGEMLKGTEGLIMETSGATLEFGDKWVLFKNKVTGAIAPLGDVIKNALGNAIEGLSASFDRLQAVIGPVMGIFKTFFDAISSAVSSALAPLTERLEALQQKFKEGSDKLTIFSDIFTIVAAAAKWLGEAIGTLVTMALTPLVVKIQEAIAILTNFYDKLGPIKGIFEGIKGVAGGVVDSISNIADSLEETVPPIEEVNAALEELAEKSPKATTAVADAWALNIKSFQEGTGTYKEAIGGIEEKITALTEEYMTATDKRKAAIEKEVEILNTEKDTLEELKQTAEDALSSTAKETEEATAKMEEFKVTIGDTTIEFKGAAAEVVKNADAYEKLQNSAQKIMDLDWSVFTEFEASLPNIESGILDMESSFVGLKDILEENIGSLENVKESVMDISEIAAPFLEAGFLEGIKAIGSFAGSLKDAGSAINTFSSLQDVSIEGCINFSMHVHDMVSALEILEDQMEDLVPAFGDMDLLIDGIADSFLYGGDKVEGFESSFENMIDNAYTLAEKGGMAFTEFSNIVDDALSTEKIGHIEEYWDVVGSSVHTATRESYLYMVEWAKGMTGVGVSFQEYFDLLNMSSEEQEKWRYDFLHTNEAITFQMDKQTNALKAQTGQLSKITEALQPYLEFMRTLNELAALSTLSTAELNSGLNSINDTLINLGKSLETFDLRPVMESLFGTKITEGDIVGFTGGTAKGFTDTMAAYQGEFSMLISYVSRLSVAITSLVSSFNALENISESVLADETKLKDLFSEIAGIMVNFSKAMGEEGFATTFATAMEMMLKSASPLIDYFQKNNAAVDLFNSTLTTFTTVIKNVVDAMDMLKRMSELALPSVTELEAGFEKVEEVLSRFTTAISTSFADVKIELVALDKEWALHEKGVEDSLESFSAATNAISTLSSEIVTLSASLKELKDMSVLSMRDIDEAMKKIPLFLDDFVDALRLNMYEITEALKDLDKEWLKHADAMKDTMPSYENSTEQIGKLIGSLLSLNSALEQLAEMGTISGAAFDKGFSSLMESISNFAGSLNKNVDGLIDSLWRLSAVWNENKTTLVPLMDTFLTVTYSFWEIANNANAMAGAFRDLEKNSGSLEKGFKSLIDFINQVVKSTKEFYTAEAAAELASFITDVGEVIDAFVDLELKLKGAMGTIKSAISTAVNNIETKLSSLSNLVKSAYYWGVNIMGAFITGIDAMSEALKAAVMRQAAIVEDYLGASSPTRLGPLSHLDEWPRNLLQSYSAGIEAEMHTLNSSFSALAPGMMTAPVAGGNKNVNFYVTQNIGSHADADYSTDQLKRMLTQHEVM